MRPSLLLLASLAAGCSCGDSPRPRNILLITLDTTRADHIGAYGDSQGATPNLDRLAAEGVLFQHAFTVTPLTIPAHSSIFTGMYPPRHGVRDNGDFMLGDGATTLAERLKVHGYDTMASVGAEVTSHHWGFAQGFDAYFDEMAPTDDKNRWHVERTGDKVVDDALAWLGEHKDGGPWFSWVHMFDAHFPYEPPEPFASRFPKAKYRGEIAFADAQVGRLVEFLQQSDQLNDTWIFVVGDHGEGLGDHGEGMHGVLLYTATTHVPFLVRPPAGNAVGRTLDFPVSLVDLTPTILGAQGFGAPTDVDGLDLSAWLRKKEPTERPTRDLYAESLYAFNHYGWAPQKVLVDATRYLLRSTTPELYALSDLAQSSDLMESEEPRFEAMDARLAALYASLLPADGASSKATLSDEQIAQLEALGYVTTGGGGGEPADNLPDPVKSLPILRRVEAARQAIREGNLDEAKTQLTQIIVDDPGLIEPRMMLATVTMRLGDAAGAMAIVEEVIRLRPGTSGPLAMLGTLKMQSADVKGAIEHLRLALDIDPHLAQTWTAYLHALFIAGQYDRMASETEAAAAALGEVTAVRGARGLIYVMQGRFAEAIPLLRSAMAEEPTMPFLHFGLGAALKEQGEVVEAEELLLEEIRMQPPSVPSRKVLVEIYAGQKRYQEQLDQLEVVLKFEGSDPMNLHSKAQALYNLQRYAEAKDTLALCIQVAPESASCTMLQANVLNKLGDRAEAEKAYQRALDLRKIEDMEGAGGRPGAPRR